MVRRHYWQLDDIFFYAHYTNATSGETITDADCEIWFDDTVWDDMIFDGTLHNYNRTVFGEGERGYNMSCTHATSHSMTVLQSAQARY